MNACTGVDSGSAAIHPPPPLLSSSLWQRRKRKRKKREKKENKKKQKKPRLGIVVGLLLLRPHTAARVSSGAVSMCLCCLTVALIPGAGGSDDEAPLSAMQPLRCAAPSAPAGRWSRSSRRTVCTLSSSLWPRLEHQSPALVGCQWWRGAAEQSPQRAVQCCRRSHCSAPRRAAATGVRAGGVRGDAKRAVSGPNTRSAHGQRVNR